MILIKSARKKSKTKILKNFRKMTMQRIFAPGLMKNKVNLVTGGGTGIGFGTAVGLLQLGSKVSLNIERVILK